MSLMKPSMIFPFPRRSRLAASNSSPRSVALRLSDRKTAKEGRWGEKVGFTGIKIDRCGSLFESRLRSRCPFQIYRLAANQG